MSSRKRSGSGSKRPKEKEEIKETEDPSFHQLLSAEMESKSIQSSSICGDAIQARLEENNYKLGSLMRDGNELCHNVVVANDQREVARRMREAELREELLELLQTESAVAIQKFQQISSNWNELDEVKDPFNMNLGLEEQKVRIAALMEQKDEIIAECRKEVQKADVNYYVDQEKHFEDLQSLSDRINNHIGAMKRIYGRQLDALQETIDAERQKIKKDSTDKWNEIFDNRSEMEQLKDIRNQGDSDLEKLILENEELIRATKVRLENDNDCLQVELQKTKTNVLLNTQKLDYNFEVLKRREEENVVMRNQQKKRLTKLYDTATNLRKNIRETTNKTTSDINKQRNDLSKLKTQIGELESSANLLAEANDLKYRKIWEMNQEECINLLKEIQVLDADISKNELGVMTPEPKEIMDIMELPSIEKAMDLLAHKSNNSGSSRQGEAMGLSNSGLRELFGKIVDKTGFIIEAKLHDILKPLQQEDSTLIKFSVFLNTFHIKEDSDLDLLIAIFKNKYMWCATCVTSPEKTCDNHHWVVEYDDVLPALEEVRMQLQRPEMTQVNSNECTTKSIKDTFSRLLDSKDVENFWKQFENMYSKEQIWTGLEYGLNQYLIVLKERETLHGDCERLRKQNEELSRLLHNQNEM